MIEHETDFREDILGLQSAVDVLDKCEDDDNEQRQKILGLMLLMIERIEIQLQEDLRQLS